MNNPTQILQTLGLTDSEIAVYLTMLSGARAARDLVKSTQLKRPTVYYALGALEKRGLISKTGSEGEKKFSVEPVQRLLSFAEEKLTEAQALKQNITELLPSLTPTLTASEHYPAVAFFEGKEAVKRAIMDMLYCKSRQINSVVPTDNFFWQTGKDFAQTFVEQRARRKIKTKNLWEEIDAKNSLKQYYAELSEIRVLPEVMKGKFKTAIFLYDNKVIYISSLKNAYCIVITSQELHDTMQAWFDGLWLGSKALKK